ncbi:hypothetical protein KFK09_000706 [Dendrobium nobile]|uniref:Uncharacterized protein n=1 Tax=Dendrobium nobile TaxID=94219 RepID=A0A8T3CFI9_DENNO|nr:hypothetical protein KFK09_000706 [Dendrobium nobile]
MELYFYNGNELSFLSVTSSLYGNGDELSFLDLIELDSASVAELQGSLFGMEMEEMEGHDMNQVLGKGRKSRSRFLSLIRIVALLFCVCVAVLRIILKIQFRNQFPNQILVSLFRLVAIRFGRDPSPSNRVVTKPFEWYQSIGLETGWIPDPDMTDGQSASQAAPVGSTAPVAGADTLAQFATLVAQMMSETQSRAVTVRSEDIDRHLQLFLRLKPPRFEGAVEPKAAEEWLRRLEKTFDGM